MFLTSKFKQFSLSGVSTYTHQETFRLFMESGWDPQIALLGGTESNIILCCYISPFPMEIKMLFRESYSTRRGNWELEGILIPRKREQKA